MTKFPLTLSLLLAATNAGAFVLLDPIFHLKKPESVKVKVSSEGCTANGVSDGEVASAIKEAVDYWNDVPESRLKLSYGGKSGTSLASSTIPANEIIVGCGALASPQILGATQNDYVNHSAKVKLNDAVYTGSYNTDSLIGTVTHEVGHGLGLFHSQDPASVMTYSSHGWQNKPKYISQDDIDGIVYLYPNEKSLGGLLGSCSSFAGDGTPERPTFVFDLLAGLFLVLGIHQLKKRLFG